MRIFTTILLSIVKLLSVAGTGDTTWVNTNESHLDWYGRKDQTVTFPDNSTSYQRIMMYATIGCPTGGCSGWDYTNKIEIRHNMTRSEASRFLALLRSASSSAFKAKN